MSGQLLRKRDPSPARHQCAPPDDAEKGAVWQCDCHRRWTCVSGVVPELADASEAVWERRYWPWPRRPKAAMTTLLSAARIPDGYVPPSASLTPSQLPRGGGHPVGGLTTEPTQPPSTPSGVSSSHKTAHCPGCRCGLSGDLTLDPQQVDVIKDNDGNTVAYLYRA